VQAKETVNNTKRARVAKSREVGKPDKFVPVPTSADPALIRHKSTSHLTLKCRFGAVASDLAILPLFGDVARW